VNFLYAGTFRVVRNNLPQDLRSCFACRLRAEHDNETFAEFPFRDPT
jgi:hypothetical protein